MNTRISIPNVPSHATTTTVFTSGNSQAVRLPKEFRFNSKHVTIEKRGDEIVLRERRPTLGELLKSLPALTKEESLEWDQMIGERLEQPAQHRDWDELFGIEKAHSKKIVASRIQTEKKRTAPRK